MNNNDCVQFLQWALPRLHLRWSGFRKVRAQVCKRIAHRLRQLNLTDIGAYKVYLEQQDREWYVLDQCCRITISRFHRDKAVFEFLAQQVFPALAKGAIARGKPTLTVWSSGCCSGEEPYTVSLIWSLLLQTFFPKLAITITATDASADLINRARQAIYTYSSIKHLPPEWQYQAFDRQQGLYRLKPDYRDRVRFFQQDIRRQIPAGLFDLVLCRNLVFTYFDDGLQREVLERIQHVLIPGGALILGIHENLPAAIPRFSPWSDKLKIYEKSNNKDQ